VLLIQKTFDKVMGANGVFVVDPTGEKFNPNLHEALAQYPDPSKEPGTVAACYKKGYKIHDRVLRAAEVAVVAQPAPQPDSGSSDVDTGSADTISGSKSS